LEQTYHYSVVFNKQSSLSVLSVSVECLPAVGEGM
jgi:hypothetical protein